LREQLADSDPNARASQENLAATLSALARVYALSAAAAGADHSESEAYAGRAVELLRQAAAKDHPNVQQLQGADDLAFLRSRADFQKLLAELEEKSKAGGK
jgi:hypothetical protein